MLYCQIWLTKMHDTDLIRYCGEEHSAAEVQQQHQVAPATRDRRHHICSSSLPLATRSRRGVAALSFCTPPHPARSGQ